MFNKQNEIQVEDNSIDQIVACGSKLLIETNSGAIYIIDPQTSPFNPIQINPPYKGCLSVTSDHKQIYLLHDNDTIEIKHGNTLKHITYAPHQTFSAKAISQYGEYLIIMGDSTIDLYTKQKCDFVRSLPTMNLSITPRLNRMLICGTSLLCEINSNHLVIWDLLNPTKTPIILQDEWIGSFYLKNEFLFIASDKCREMEGTCSIAIKKFPDLLLKAKIGTLKDDHYFQLDSGFSNSLKQPFLIATSPYTVDLWTWDSWNLLGQITDVVDINSSFYFNGHLYLGDIQGTIYEFSE